MSTNCCDENNGVFWECINEEKSENSKEEGEQLPEDNLITGAVVGTSGDSNFLSKLFIKIISWFKNLFY